MHCFEWSAKKLAGGCTALKRFLLYGADLLETIGGIFVTARTHPTVSFGSSDRVFVEPTGPFGRHIVRKGSEHGDETFDWVFICIG
mmetsp:Transcript_6860/g.14284  ORF Transcript_6860/g.14284 Transcript_6860/m.14284 type:complete len:86 (+) Transcript_6860:618-875(+)